MRGLIANASNRLTQVQVGDDAEASKVSYLHNAAGQRVFKSEPQVAQTAPSEQELGSDFITWLKKNFGWLFAQAQQNATLVQSYVYGDGPINSYHLLGEYGNGGTKSAGRMEYIYLPTETGTAQLIGLYKNNRFCAVHTDHLGTPRQITDDRNKVVWQWAYSAFGDNKPTGILKATTNPKQAITNQPKLLTATSPSFPVNLRFPGQYWDDESKLSYNTFRSYRPAQGRYTQPDPIGLEGGWSRFGYVGGNPLSFIDPMGLDAIIVRNGRVEYFNSQGELVGNYAYTSGVPECGCDSTTPNKGPIPAGAYTADPRQISEGGFLRSLLGDWGRFRVPLKPGSNTQTFGRDGFFLHGGKKPGPAGCIDVGDRDIDLFRHLKNAPGPVPVSVY